MKLSNLLIATTVLTASISTAWADSLEDITKKAQQEGVINSIGMPDIWANWQDTWQDISKSYNLKHTDTDMSSAQELAKFKAEKNNASADIGDIGLSFGPIAVQMGVVQAYKPTTWEQIPAWAKDQDGYWMASYTGTIAFLIDKSTTKKTPRSWQDLLTADYIVSIGDVSSASQAISAVLAANYALGGDEKNLTPALEYFAKLAKQKRLKTINPSVPIIEKGEANVYLVWDFNALNYRDQIRRDRFEILIPQDGSLISGYSTVINKYAKHPNAAKLTREYILSDAGQLNLAKGYARPIRANFITIPADIQAKLLAQEQYKSAKPIQDSAAWETTTKQLPSLWQQKVVIHLAN